MTFDSSVSKWESVPVETVYAIFKEVVAPPGFGLLKGGTLAQRIDDNVTHLIVLGHYKGGMYGLQWGVSLTFVPHTWENDLRWHRTPKSARFDLWEHLFDLPDSLNLAKQPLNSSIPSSLHGPKLFENNLRREWESLRSTIAAWLEQVRDTSGVLARSSEQMKRKWTGPHHWPPPSLVHAFTLARVGRSREASLELNALIDKEISDPNQLLRSALDRVSAASTRPDWLASMKRRSVK